MARFVKIGAHYVNQEQIVQVFPSLEHDGVEGITVGLTNLSIMHLEGHEREAFLLWLDGHVRQWGTDALDALAQHIRQEHEPAVVDELPF